jgi:hypothetical protein
VRPEPTRAPVLLLPTRRALLTGTAAPLAAAALAPTALASPAAGGEARGPHFAPRARRLVYLFLSGGPSQLDLWDDKPGLAARYDQDLPDSIRQGQRITTMTSGQKRLPIAPSRFRFARHGGSGIAVSELLPHLAQQVDELCVIRSMHTEAINHEPAVNFLCTGHELPGRPSAGAWLDYGLGSEARDLPAFVVMTPRWSGPKVDQGIYSRLWGAGFLPGRHQGTALRGSGDPVLFLRDPPGLPRELRRAQVGAIGELNALRREAVGDPEIDTRTAQYEMAFRMQEAVPELLQLDREPEAVLRLYGPEVRTPGTFAHSCLLARRLLERGTRTVQLFHKGWDQHKDVGPDLPDQCRDVDQPSAGLILDLKQRGLLDDTLIVCTGEFGRTVYCQGDLSRDNYGRDHHPRCFSSWLCGGGVRRGHVHGETDEFSYNIVRDAVHVHDLNATILHLLGLDHERLVFRFQGRDMRLTDVAGRVVRGLLA